MCFLTQFNILLIFLRQKGAFRANYQHEMVFLIGIIYNIRCIKSFFSFEKCQRILQRHFSVLRNVSAFCKAIFQFWEMPAHFAKPFFSFEKCQRNLQKHFSFLRNASAFCKSIFHFWEMPAHFAKPFFSFEKCQRNLHVYWLPFELFPFGNSSFFCEFPLLINVFKVLAYCWNVHVKQHTHSFLGTPNCLILIIDFNTLFLPFNLKN